MFHLFECMSIFFDPFRKLLPHGFGFSVWGRKDDASHDCAFDPNDFGADSKNWGARAFTWHCTNHFFFDKKSIREGHIFSFCYHSNFQKVISLFQKIVMFLCWGVLYKWIVFYLNINILFSKLQNFNFLNLRLTVIFFFFWRIVPLSVLNV